MQIRSRLATVTITAALAAGMLTALGVAVPASVASARTAPPVHQVKQQSASPVISATSTSSKTTAPQATISCSNHPEATYTSNYNAQNTLIEVYVQNTDEPSCTADMSRIAEDDNVVTPHAGTHNIGDASCSDCSSLPVYGSYLCSTGLECAGKYVAEWKITLTDPPGYVFTSWSSNCTPSDNDTVLTCTSSAPTTVPPYLPCQPQAYSDYVHVSSTPPATASSHGYWFRGDCGVPKANVTIQLQEYFSNGQWYNIGSPSSKLTRPGTGSTVRVNVRATCDSTGVAGWRSVDSVTVPVQGGSDTYTSDGKNIACSVNLPGVRAAPVG
jgi:hypothetical protein